MAIDQTKLKNISRQLADIAEQTSRLTERVRSEGITQNGRVLLPPERTEVRDVRLEGSQPIELSRETARTAGTAGVSAGQSASPYQAFSQRLMEMLTQAQQGITPQVYGLESQALGLEAERARTGMQTPEELIGAPPSLQAGVRGAEMGAFEPGIERIRQVGRGLSTRLELFKSGLEQAQELAKTMQETEQTRKNEMRDILFKFPNAIRNLPQEQKQQFEKDLGLPKGFVDTIPEVVEEKWSEPYKLDTGETAQRNTKTGEIKIVSKPAGVGGLTPTQLFDRELKLANDFERYAKETRGAVNQLGIMKTAWNAINEAMKTGKIFNEFTGEYDTFNLNAPSQAMLVTFQKLLDPTSVVRESEYARSGEGQSLKNRIEGTYLKLTRGGAGVTINDLQQFYTLSQQLLKGYQDQQLNYAQRTKAQAESIGANLERVLTPDVLNLLRESEEPETKIYKGQTYIKVEGGWQLSSQQSQIQPPEITQPQPQPELPSLKYQQGFSQSTPPIIF